MGQFEPLPDSSAARPSNKAKVTYLYHPDLELFHYGPEHYMKPKRMGLTNDLVNAYGLTKKMDMTVVLPASIEEIKKFHDDEYVNFLSSISPDILKFSIARTRSTEESDLTKQLDKFHLGNPDNLDNPVFDGMYDFSALSVGASLAGARKLSKRECDIAINWVGGLHHAMSNHAHGFCYLNDGVLGILELLEGGFDRVLYIDIDLHHGDGVEKAFEETDRVMTVSFHKYSPVRGEFFPGTGALHHIGQGPGTNYAVNVPLRDGISSVRYRHVFRHVISEVMKRYRPSAIVLQCGADSLAHDKIGTFNVSMDGHADCVKYVKAFNLPLLVLGGGGYTAGNVSKTWAYETGVLVGEELARNVPSSLTSYAYYDEPDMVLDVPADLTGKMKDKNDPKYLSNMIMKISQRLQEIPHAPSIQSQHWNYSRRNCDNDDDDKDGEGEDDEGGDNDEGEDESEDNIRAPNQIFHTGGIHDISTPQNRRQYPGFGARRYGYPLPLERSNAPPPSSIRHNLERLDPSPSSKPDQPEKSQNSERIDPSPSFEPNQPEELKSSERIDSPPSSEPNRPEDSQSSESMEPSPFSERTNSSTSGLNQAEESQNSERIDPSPLELNQAEESQNSERISSSPSSESNQSEHSEYAEDDGDSDGSDSEEAYNEESPEPRTTRSTQRSRPGTRSQKNKNQVETGTRSDSDTSSDIRRRGTRRTQRSRPATRSKAKKLVAKTNQGDTDSDDEPMSQKIRGTQKLEGRTRSKGKKSQAKTEEYDSNEDDSNEDDSNEDDSNEDDSNEDGSNEDDSNQNDLNEDGSNEEDLNEDDSDDEPLLQKLYATRQLGRDTRPERKEVEAEANGELGALSTDSNIQPHQQKIKAVPDTNENSDETGLGVFRKKFYGSKDLRASTHAKTFETKEKSEVAELEKEEKGEDEEEDEEEEDEEEEDEEEEDEEEEDEEEEDEEEESEEEEDEEEEDEEEESEEEEEEEEYEVEEDEEEESEEDEEDETDEDLY